MHRDVLANPKLPEVGLPASGRFSSFRLALAAGAPPRGESAGNCTPKLELVWECQRTVQQARFVLISEIDDTFIC